MLGVHSNIVEWDNPVAVNPQEPFANLSHPTPLVPSKIPPVVSPWSTVHHVNFSPQYLLALLLKKYLIPSIF